MATVTHEIGTAATAVGPLASGAFTPAAGDLLVVFVVASATVDATAAVTNSAGITFTQVTSTTKVAGDTMYVFVANSFATAVSQTCTITFPGDNSTGQIIFVEAVAGMSRTGLDAIRQFAVQANQASGIPAPVFASAVLTGNPTLGCVGNATNPAAMTAPTSWTEGASTGDLGYATPTTGGEVVFRDSGFTGTTVTWGSTSASGFGSIVVELDSSAPPLVETLVDDFDTLEAGVWDTTGTVGITSGRLDITPGSTYATCQSDDQFTLTGSFVYVEVPQVATGSVPEFDTEFGVWLDANNRIQFIHENGTLYFRKKVGGVNSDTTIAYNATTHRWWKLTESGGTLQWWTSPDNVTWTSRRSITWTDFALASLKVDFSSGWWSGGSPSITNNALYDNLNFQNIIQKAGTATAGTDLEGVSETGEGKLGAAKAGAVLTGAKSVTTAHAGGVTAQARLTGLGITTGYGVVGGGYGGGSYGRLVAGVAGTTYNKVGKAVASTVARATDVFEAVEAGTATADTTATAADVFEASDTGTAVADTTATGADVFEAVEQGVATADTTVTGDQAPTFDRAGTTTADTLATATDVFEAVETGKATSSTLATAADVFEATEAGTATADTLALAADVFTAAETGAAVADTLVTGPDVFQATEIGKAVAGTKLAGTSAAAVPDSNTGYGDGTYATGTYGVREAAPVIYAKTGAVVADTLASASDVFEAVETGAATADTLATGADVFQATETGTCTTTSNATGADVFEAVETGAAAADTTVTGSDAFTAAEAGTTAAGTKATGADTFDAVESATATADTTLAGAQEKVLAGKAGTATAGTKLTGGDASTLARTGVVVSQTVASGADVFTATETGAVVTVTRLLGTPEFIYGGEAAPVTHVPTGGIYDQTTTGGVVVAKIRSGRVVERPRNGTVRQVVRAGSHDESSTGGEVL